ASRTAHGVREPSSETADKGYRQKGTPAMPLLTLEPFVSPDDLFSATAGPPAEGRWWVLHTRPRAEKRLARELLRHCRSFFLPLHTRTWRSRGSTLSSHLPLFPGYVFLHGEGDARWTALETNQVARVIE